MALAEHPEMAFVQCNEMGVTGKVGTEPPDSDGRRRPVGPRSVRLAEAVRPARPDGASGYWQVGNLNDAMRVFQLNAPVLFRYSVVYQKVQSSTGSTVIAL